MGVSELEESSLLLDEKLLQFMDQLELLEEKRATLNSLIEQVTKLACHFILFCVIHLCYWLFFEIHWLTASYTYLS